MMKRRNFLTTTALGTAGLTLSAKGFSTVSSGVLGANDKVVLALIGAGGRGTEVLLGILKNNKNVEVKYICDCFDFRSARGAKAVEDKFGYKPQTAKYMQTVFDDKDVDAVIVGTPEHWHALASVWACQAGKDVYVEKNPSLGIWEGRKMVEAAERYNRIIQIGTQNRSSSYGHNAREYIKSGKLGDLVIVKAFCMKGGSGKWTPGKDVPAPDGLDWDEWLGPAAYRPYNNGIHNINKRGGWQSFWDFSGGTFADDGSHVIDFARLAIGDPNHPKSVYCCGGNWPWGSKRPTPEMQMVTYDYGDFVMTMESGNATPYNKKTPPEIRYSLSKFPYWMQNSTRIEIYGTKGMMMLGRHGGGWQVFGRDGEVLDQEYGMHPDKEHQQDFINSIRTRKENNGTPLQGHLSATLVHLGNISYRLGNKQLYFDAKKEEFTNMKEANKLLKPNYRGKYTMPDKV